MEQFLIFYAPLLVLALSVIGLFWWGAKGNVTVKK